MTPRTSSYVAPALLPDTRKPADATAPGYTPNTPPYSTPPMYSSEPSCVAAWTTRVCTVARFDENPLKEVDVSTDPSGEMTAMVFNELHGCTCGGV